MRGWKAARIAYQTPKPSMALENRYLNLSITIGDLVFRINKDREELRKLFGSMGTLTKEGEKERVREESLAEERARKAQAAAQREKAQEAIPNPTIPIEGVPA